MYSDFSPSIIFYIENVGGKIVRNVGKLLLDFTLSHFRKNVIHIHRREMIKYHELVLFHSVLDRLCGLVVRVRGYKSRGRGFDYRRYQIFSEVVGLQRGPLRLLRITEELLERKVVAAV
jgi:hypothetical protein